MISIRLVAFGIAKDILKGSKMSFEVEANSSIAALKEQLSEEFPEFSKLASLRFAINEDYQSDDYILNPNDEVVIIPPVSGG